MELICFGSEARAQSEQLTQRELKKISVLKRCSQHTLNAQEQTEHHWNVPEKSIRLHCLWGTSSPQMLDGLDTLRRVVQFALPNNYGRVEMNSICLLSAQVLWGR